MQEASEEAKKRYFKKYNKSLLKYSCRFTITAQPNKGFRVDLMYDPNIKIDWISWKEVKSNYLKCKCLASNNSNARQPEDIVESFQITEQYIIILQKMAINNKKKIFFDGQNTQFKAKELLDLLNKIVDLSQVYEANTNVDK